MKSRSVVERSIKDTQLIKCQLNSTEIKTFNKIKRSLIRTFINPNYGVKMLIDLSALEYIRYVRGLNGETNISRVATSVKDILSELDLTPRSRKSSEVTKTLSQIFQNVIENKETSTEIKEEEKDGQ